MQQTLLQNAKVVYNNLSRLARWGPLEYIMSTAVLERPATEPALVSDAPRRVRRQSLVEQIERELLELPEATFDCVSLQDCGIIPHGRTARRIDRFGIRRVNSLPVIFQKIPAFAQTVGVGWYDVPDDELCGDHFGILAGKETFEAVTHAAAGMIRSTVACQQLLPVLDGECRFSPRGMVLPGYTIQSIVWISDINEKMRGTAEGFAQVNGMEVMTVEFDFRLVDWNVFVRARDGLPSKIADWAARREGADRIIH